MKELYCSVCSYMAVSVMKCMHTTIDGLGIETWPAISVSFSISYVASLRKIATLFFRSPCCIEAVSPLTSCLEIVACGLRINVR